MSGLNPKILSKCAIEQNDGILLKVEIKPNSKTTGIEGVDEWRRCVKVRIKARAEKGKANMELIDLLSSSLSLPSSSIIIIKGERSHQKTIKILGLTIKELIWKL